jgi:hypothetical protein
VLTRSVLLLRNLSETLRKNGYISLPYLSIIR